MESTHENLISDVTKKTENKNQCIFCGEEIDVKYSFCTKCGKSQIKKKRALKRIIKVKKKRNFKITLLSLFSYISFFAALIFFAGGYYKMLFFNTVSVSIFGGNSESLIANQTVVIGSFFMSLIFLVLGIFLNVKQFFLNINKKQ